MKNLSLKSLLILLCIFSPLFSEVRGLWVVRHALGDSAEHKKIYQLVDQLNLTDLFVQVRGRGDVYYRSDIEPPAESMENCNYDPLAKFITAKGNRNVRIHAWVNTFYIWSNENLPQNKQHLLWQHPEWLARPINSDKNKKPDLGDYKKSNAEGYFISPANADHQCYFKNLITELLENYPLDGLHLDYIRYPGTNYDVNEITLSGYQAKHILNPIQFLSDPNRFASKFGLTGYMIFKDYWKKHLISDLSNFVDTLSRSAKSINPELIFSAAVKPTPIEAKWNYYQDWQKWLSNKSLDWALPMNYTPSNKLFDDRINDYMRKLDLSKLVIGIALYNQPQLEVIRKIARVQALGSTGFVLFSYEQLKNQKQIQNYLRQK